MSARSASERLNEWDEYLPLYSNQNWPPLWKLRQALPELIAVVQAAEQVWRSAEKPLPQLHDSLAALREHLEKGTQ